MFIPSSKIEVQDLLYAVQTRQEYVTRFAEEAEIKAPDVAKDLRNELGRLSIIKQRLEQHQSDLDYKDDCRGMYGDICTD